MWFEVSYGPRGRFQLALEPVLSFLSLSLFVFHRVFLWFNYYIASGILTQTVSEPFQSRFRAVSEQFQSSFRSHLEQIYILRLMSLKRLSQDSRKFSEILEALIDVAGSAGHSTSHFLPFPPVGRPFSPFRLNELYL